MAGPKTVRTLITRQHYRGLIYAQPMSERTMRDSDGEKKKKRRERESEMQKRKEKRETKGLSENVQRRGETGRASTHRKARKKERRRRSWPRMAIKNLTFPALPAILPTALPAPPLRAVAVMSGDSLVIRHSGHRCPLGSPGLRSFFFILTFFCFRFSFLHRHMPVQPITSRCRSLVCWYLTATLIVAFCFSLSPRANAVVGDDSMRANIVTPPPAKSFARPAASGQKPPSSSASRQRLIALDLASGPSWSLLGPLFFLVFLSLSVF